MDPQPYRFAGHERDTHGTVAALCEYPPAPPGPCADEVTVAGEQTGTKRYVAVVKVEAMPGVTVASGADVTFRAGERVVLNEGFAVEAEAEFVAENAVELVEGVAVELDYMHARYCSPVLGRFLSVDPKLLQRATKKPQRWNRYTYAINNPLKFVDPDGRDIMLFVRNNSGGGLTNFGHVALRVHGNGYDKTFDFGRYRGGRGFLRAKGPGILRVWKNFDAFKAGQRTSGASKAVNLTTTPAQDQQALGFFQGKIDQGKQLPGNLNSNFTEFQLQQDYELTSNNCTTICVDAIESVEGLESEADALEGQYDPREIYLMLEELFEENPDAELLYFSAEPE